MIGPKTDWAAKVVLAFHVSNNDGWLDESEVQ
jgi:hypothetical protein